MSRLSHLIVLALVGIALVLVLCGWNLHIGLGPGNWAFNFQLNSPLSIIRQWKEARALSKYRDAKCQRLLEQAEAANTPEKRAIAAQALHDFLIQLQPPSDATDDSRKITSSHQTKDNPGSETTQTPPADHQDSQIR